VRLRDRIKAAARARDPSALEEAVAESPRCLRHLMGMTYDANPEVRAFAGQGIAIAFRYHPRKVKEQVTRLVWAMDNRANTNAVTAPEALAAIAAEAPQLLLPLVADLAQLGRDPVLRDGIARILETLRQARPGEVGRRMAADLTDKMHHGMCDV
jgi:hypothetical protein